jgi:hypothetical protein
MTGSRDDDESRVVADRGSEPLTESSEALIVLSGEYKDRHVELADTSPERLLRSGPAETKRGSKASRRVLHSRAHACCVVGQAGEERRLEPTDEECSEHVFVAHGLVELARQELVGSDSSGALLGVIDPRSRPDQCGSSHRTGARQRCMQQHAAAERVADVVGRSAGIRCKLSCLPQIRAQVGRTSMAREVHGVHCVGRREDLSEWSPRAGVLCEPMQKRNRAARSEPPDLEPIGASRAARPVVCHER